MTDKARSNDEDRDGQDGRGAMPDTGGMDTTMAAGPHSGASGVANAGLGTSGEPPENFLTPEELAETEVIGGAGLDPNDISNAKLKDYLHEIDPTPDEH